MVSIGKTCRRRRRRSSSSNFYHYQCRLNLGWMILIIPLLHLAVANDIPFVCHVCGEGQRVTRPYGVVTLPNQPSSFFCSSIEKAGYHGDIDISSCRLLPYLLQDICQCASTSISKYSLRSELITERQVSPVAPPSSSSSPVTTTPQATIVLTDAPTKFLCSVCGDGLTISLPNEIFEFVGQPTVTCSELQIAGQTGYLTSNQCLALPQIIKNTCGCISINSEENNQSLNPQASTSNSPLTMTTNVTSSPISTIPSMDTAVPTNDIGTYSKFPSNIPSDNPSLLPSDVPSDTPSYYASDISSDTISDVPSDFPSDIPSYNANLPPAASPTCPDVPLDGCSICGENMCVGNPNGLVVIPDQPPVPCSLLEEAGYRGQLTSSQCRILPFTVRSNCMCGNQHFPTLSPVVAPYLQPMETNFPSVQSNEMTGLPTASSVPSYQPSFSLSTPSPSDPPTNVQPTPSPSDSPTNVQPTPSPSDPPTNVQPTPSPSDSPTNVQPTPSPSDSPSNVQTTPSPTQIDSEDESPILETPIYYPESFSYFYYSEGKGGKKDGKGGKKEMFQEQRGGGKKRGKRGKKSRT